MLYNLYCPIFKFTPLFISFYHSVHPVNILLQIFYFSVLEFSFVSLFIVSTSYLRLLFIHSGKNICLKILVANFNIWVISGLDLIDFHFNFISFHFNSRQCIPKISHVYCCLINQNKIKQTKQQTQKPSPHQRIVTIQKNHNLTFIMPGYNLKFLKILRKQENCFLVGGRGAGSLVSVQIFHVWLSCFECSVLVLFMDQ